MSGLIPHTLKTYLTKKRIGDRIELLAGKLTDRYTGLEDETVFLCVLKGAFIFSADLVRNIPLNIPLEFCTARSYGDSMNSDGNVSLSLPPKRVLREKNVVILEDIIDTGCTLAVLKDKLKELGASRVEICSLLSKPSRRKAKVEIDYLGFEVPDLFFVGFGLDYAENYRNLDHLAVVIPSKKNS
ncbi:MAG: hypoxanthine phosphoribosyltransferase [Planctomycetota bacterium]|nr:hypoxanthine phosphoribosyltransferase [Planctomycetota bacterium]